MRGDSSLSEQLLELKRADVGSPTAAYRATQIEKIFEALSVRVEALEQSRDAFLEPLETSDFEKENGHGWTSS
jgi:hypothetical protein